MAWPLLHLDKIQESYTVSYLILYNSLALDGARLYDFSSVLSVILCVYIYLIT